MDNKPFYWKKNQPKKWKNTHQSHCLSSAQRGGCPAVLGAVFLVECFIRGFDDDRMLSAPGIVMWMQYFLHQVPNRKHEVKTFIWFL